MPKSVIFISNNINFCQSTNLTGWRLYICQNRMFIKSEFVRSFCERIVKIFLKCNTKWKWYLLISTFWKSYFFRRRLANQMFVIKNLCIYYNVVIICTKFASSEFFQIIIESFSNNENICILLNRSRAWIHFIYSVRFHRKITLAPWIWI